MSQVLTCPNCGATAEIGEGIESGQFVCAKCKSTVGFGPGRTSVGDALTGRRLAGYEVSELLGAGGMGKVYLARQISIDRPVALKILAARLAENENFTKRFIREAQAAGRLLHQNLVTVFDAGKEGNTYYFSMEYVEGESLSKLIFERGKLPVGESLAIVRQVAEALNCAFEHGIIHRDIKPDNIMITASGRVKLADLGLAKDIESDGGESGLTVAGSVMGTPHYLAPEQARNSRDVDQRADVYSLGCTLYHSLTGKVPFSGSSTYEILRKHETDEPVFTADCGIPEPVQALVRRMMAKEPQERPQTPREVLAAIDEIIGAASTGAISRAPGTIGSMPTEAAPGTSGYARTPPPAVPAEPMKPPKRKSRLKKVLVAVAIVIGVIIVLSAVLDNKRWQIADREYNKTHRYAMENPGNYEEIQRMYEAVAAEFKGTNGAKKAQQALAYENVRRYAVENSGDAVGTLQKYAEFARENESTEWGASAKEQVLAFALAAVLEKEPENLDAVLVQMKKIEQETADEEFAKKLGEKLTEFNETRQTQVELEFRRFRDGMEKLLREGKYNEARTRVDVYVKDKGLTAIPVLVQKFTQKTRAMAQVEQVAKGFFNAVLARDWDKALKYTEPVSEKDKTKRKSAVAFFGNALIKTTQPRNYRVVRIQVDLDKGRAQISSMMTISRKRLGNRIETVDVPIESEAVLHHGKWYISLEAKSKKPIRDKTPSEEPKRRPRRQSRD